MKQLDLDKTTTINKIRATWSDVNACVALIEDELSKSYDFFQKSSGLRARLLMKHANRLLKEMIALSQHHDKLVKSHASKQSNHITHRKVQSVSQDSVHESSTEEKNS